MGARAAGAGRASEVASLLGAGAWRLCTGAWASSERACWVAANFAALVTEVTVAGGSIVSTGGITAIAPPRGKSICSEVPWREISGIRPAAPLHHHANLGPGDVGLLEGRDQAKPGRGPPV